jgi:outer membrane protein OmpA-like peptidoglycan-associated protein
MGAQGPAGPQGPQGTAGVAGAAGPRGADAVWLTVSDILFEFDKAVLRQEEAPKIKEVADFLKRNEGVVLRLDGHTDPRGTDGYNAKLSERRVEAVRKALIDAGAPASQIDIAAYGEKRPKCDQKTEECFQLDRRVEVLFGSPGAAGMASPGGPGGRRFGAPR